jgi:glycosyltransferase involved in cell wall biosynthesis
MKIVYLNPSGQLGGAEISLLDMLASLRVTEPGWPLHLIIAEDGPFVSRARARGVPTTVVPFQPTLMRLGDAGAGGPAGKQQSRLALLYSLLGAGPAAFAYARQLRSILVDLNPDVIHSNGFKMHVLGAWAKPHNVPLIWHIHDYVSARPVMARLLRRFSTRCSMVVANSRSVAEDVRAVCGEHLTVRTIYNGIDVESFSPMGPQSDLDALSGMPPAAPETVRVGMLATLARWKGHRTFLRALSLLPQNLPVRGYVLGGALYRTTGSQHSLAELKDLATKLGVSHRVGFTGFLDQPADAMRALDIVVHASTQPEPFGLVIAEGMACGRAVIVSEAGGAMELIDADANALCHPPGDAARLAERIALLAADRSLRARLGAAGRATAEQRFNRARLASELIPIYRAVNNGSNF